MKPIRRGTNESVAAEPDTIPQQILGFGNRGVGRIEFLRETSKLLLEFLHCEELELRLHDPDLSYRWEITNTLTLPPRFTILKEKSKGRSAAKPSLHKDRLETLCRELLAGRRARAAAPFQATARGSVWTGGRPGGSLALIPFTVDERTAGVLRLRSQLPAFFTEADVERCEDAAQTLGLAISIRRAQWALRERVKELTCLYEIGRIAQLRDISLEEVIQQIAGILPAAWQFPEIACARIVLNGKSFETSDFRPGPHRQTADLIIQGSARGMIEVSYTEDRLEFAEGPFLREERSLIETVAREVALIVERRKGEEGQARLQAQLRHADRLATIGQLAAGVAHELNEPLGSILGFAQLVQKAPALPQETAADVGKIVKAALHAREIIHKLLVFARQKTPVKSQVNLNRIVEEGLYFLESRCLQAGIQVELRLAPGLPEVRADASQLHQVLVNLLVNSIQAMPEGGTLAIETGVTPDCVILSVQDSGCGMTNEVKERIFTPFFTTKDIDQGTGLGLAVVHGIVSAHGGSILVDSAPGRGARFEVRLPHRGDPEVAEDD